MCFISYTWRNISQKILLVFLFHTMANNGLNNMKARFWLKVRKKFLPVRSVEPMVQRSDGFSFIGCLVLSFSRNWTIWNSFIWILALNGLWTPWAKWGFSTLLFHRVLYDSNCVPWPSCCKGMQCIFLTTEGTDVWTEEASRNFKTGR